MCFYIKPLPLFQKRFMMLFSASHSSFYWAQYSWSNSNWWWAAHFTSAILLKFIIKWQQIFQHFSLMTKCKKGYQLKFCTGLQRYKLIDCIQFSFFFFFFTLNSICSRVRISNLGEMGTLGVSWSYPFSKTDQLWNPDWSKLFPVH